MSRVKWIIILAAFLSCKFVLAQNTYSPYTVIGIGDMNDRGLSNNAAMGNVGIAAPSVWHINNMNPALLTYNSLTVFEIGVEGESRTVSNSFNSAKVGTGGLKYLTLAFPIMPGTWTSSIGMMPYSSVNYSFTVTDTIPGTNSDQSVIEFVGDGGLNQVYFSNGVKLFKSLTLGLRMSYIFGLIEETTQTYLLGDGLNQQLPTGHFLKTNYSGFNLGLGAAYRLSLNEKDGINFGLTYDLGNDLKGTRFEQNQYIAGNGNVISGDTLTNELKSSYHLPSEIGFGISWQKLNKLMLALDVKRAIWDENAGFADDNEQYRSIWVIGLGFEITPKYNDVNSYFKRVKYRFGVDFKQEPFMIDGKTVNNFGINFGWSLPVKGVSALNMAFKYGQRGEASGALVKEQYFKFVLGATINDRWFVRRKYN